jgi:aminoglycoside 2'-N-acetyltransferase I
VGIRTAPTADLTPAELGEIHALLVDAFAGDFSADDWGHTLGGWHVVAGEGGAIVAHAAVVERVLVVGGRPLRAGYVEAVATAPGRQGRGHGSAVMARVGDLLHAHAELGALATGRHGFYERLGWERWRGPTFVRREAGREPTPEDDDAVMVLRFGTSRGLALDQPLTCDDRPGDPW